MLGLPVPLLKFGYSNGRLLSKYCKSTKPLPRLPEQNLPRHTAEVLVKDIKYDGVDCMSPAMFRLYRYDRQPEVRIVLLYMYVSTETQATSCTQSAKHCDCVMKGIYVYQVQKSV